MRKRLEGTLEIMAELGETTTQAILVDLTILTGRSQDFNGVLAKQPPNTSGGGSSSYGFGSKFSDSKSTYIEEAMCGN